MSTNQIAAGYRGSSTPSLAIAIAAAFVVGALLGLAMQGALDRASERPNGGSRPFLGVTKNNMSDAANAAQHGATMALATTATARPLKGVADNNMSDAANAAQWGRDAAYAGTAGRSFKGVADNNMTEAARLATYAEPN